MTSQNIVIREESETDIPTISDITLAAFQPLDISSHTEHFIIDALRAAGALSVSLVAEVDGRIVGHIAFSPVTMSDGSEGWYGLGPVSVHPDFQRQGIGKALINEGLARLKGMNAKGCCLVGHPEYYRQFGFVNTDALAYEGVPAEYFFVLPFDESVPQGMVVFHEGFNAGPVSQAD